MLERFRCGDPVAFEAVYDTTVRAAHEIARRICRDPALADDALQNAYLDAWRSARNYDPAAGTIATWVTRIVRNRSIDTLRRVAVHERRRAGEEWMIELPARGELVEQVILADSARSIHTALRTLPDEQRRVIKLAFIGGLSHSEIAACTGAPIGTVKGRMRLGLSRLRDALLAEPDQGRPALEAVPLGEPAPGMRAVAT